MAAQFLGKIIEALQTTMTALGTKADSQVAALGSMEAKLDTEITKLQAIIDGQYKGLVYIKASDTVQKTESPAQSISNQLANETDYDLKEMVLLTNGIMRLKVTIENEYESDMYDLSNARIVVKLNGIEAERSDSYTLDQFESHEFSVDFAHEVGDVMTVCIWHDGIDTGNFQFVSYEMCYDETADNEIVLF